MPGTAGCPGGSTAGWPSGSFVAPAAKGQVMRSPEEFAAASFAYGQDPVDAADSQENEEAMNERTPLSRVSELGAPSSVAADTAGVAWLLIVLAQT